MRSRTSSSHSDFSLESPSPSMLRKQRRTTFMSPSVVLSTTRNYSLLLTHSISWIKHSFQTTVMELWRMLVASSIEMNTFREMNYSLTQENKPFITSSCMRFPTCGSEILLP